MSSINMAQETDLTRDRFLGDRLLIAQPRNGFRAGLDSVLLAAAINPEATSVLDLGSGAGTVACCALEMLPEAHATLVEKHPDLLEMGRQNLNRNGFTSRAATICLDVTAKGNTRLEAGLKSDHFTSVVSNPPFFDGAQGTLSPDAARADARHMEQDQLDLWVKTAAACAAPRGEIIFIHLAQVLPRLLQSFARRFGGITVLPIVPRPSEEATRVLVRAIKASRAPLRLLSPLNLHGQEGHIFSQRAEEIFRGQGRLHW